MSLKLVKEEAKEIDLSKLNKEQLEAVKHINGPLLIVAGAGSGKTRVLTERVAYLIHKGVDPGNILALTFTNKAANEMKQRIGRIVTKQQAERVWAGTFHSIFARIIRRHADKIGYTRAFSIFDTNDTEKLIKRIMNDHGIPYKKYPPQNIRSRISNAKNQLLSWQEFTEQAEGTFDKTTAIVYKDYEEALIQNNAMDFDDLLINMISLLRSSKETLVKYQKLFKYILVDEYQDTNRAQYIAINMLAKAHSNICVVGDDAQSIYKWRGADIRNILDFKKDYPNAKVIRLEQNYRSTKAILAAADSVIKNNKDQIPKSLWTDNTDGEVIEIYRYSDERLEANTIVQIIKKLKSGEYDLRDFAILYRTNAQSLALEKAMRTSNIPYVIVGGISFYQRKEIKDGLAYLKVLVNPNDTVSLLRIVNEPPRGLGKTSIDHIFKYAKDNNITLYESFLQAHNNEKLQRRAKRAAQDFIYFINEYSEKIKQENTPETLLNYIDRTGLLDMYKEINTEESLDRYNNIQQLLSDISQYYRTTENPNVEDYLQQISLITDLDQKDISDNQVTLMTLHSAKGLEYPVVFIAGMEQGLFPNAKSEYDIDQMEEERRLFYVGITRAKEKLYLTYSKKRMRFGKVDYQTPSRFLNEVDPELVLWNGVKAPKEKPKKEIPKPENSQNYFDDISKEEESYSQLPPEDELRRGDRVKHAQFGVGRIENISGSGRFQKAVVMFHTAGRKQLMVKFAKLEKL